MNQQGATPSPGGNGNPGTLQTLMPQMMKDTHQDTPAVRLVESFGATHNPALSSKSSAWFNLITPHGLVTVAIMAAWVHIRLPKPLIEAASRDNHDKPNPFSGKWNIMHDNEQHDELNRRLLWIVQQ